MTRDDLATIIYTSGTTGPPKGVMLSHGNLLSNAEATLETSAMLPSDVLLSWLPYSHIYARTVDHYLTVLAGSVVAMAESVDTLVANLAEVQPTRLTAIPRFYEKVWLGVEGLEPEVRKRHLHHIFGPRIRQLSSGGRRCLRHVAEGFHAAGLPLLEGYGLTESSPVISFNRLERYKLGSVGLAIPGVEIKIADDGEILTRGPHVMQGYWKDPEATREAIVDGWLHTGDVGQLDDEGFLTITDRKKDLIITSGGKNIAPSELERLLVSDPYIDQAVVFGDARPFVSALIVPNFALLEAKANELGCTLETAEGFIRTPALHDFMADRVAGLMKVVSGPERVKRFLLLERRVPARTRRADLEAERTPPPRPPEVRGTPRCALRRATESKHSRRRAGGLPGHFPCPNSSARPGVCCTIVGHGRSDRIRSVVGVTCERSSRLRDHGMRSRNPAGPCSRMGLPARRHRPGAGGRGSHAERPDDQPERGRLERAGRPATPDRFGDGGGEAGRPDPAGPLPLR